MSCHVCGSGLEVDSLINDARGTGRFLVCTWCFARISEIEGKSPTQFPYQGPADRWTAVDVSGSDEEHGFARGSETLCGLDVGNGEGMMRHCFQPERDGACPKCAAFALEVDARWPAGVHGKP